MNIATKKQPYPARLYIYFPYGEISKNIFVCKINSYFIIHTTSHYGDEKVFDKIVVV